MPLPRGAARVRSFLVLPAAERLRTANPYVVDSALAALVLFAVSLQWIFPDEGDDRLTWQGWLIGAATAVPLVWRRRAPFVTACAVSVATPCRRSTTRRRRT